MENLSSSAVARGVWHQGLIEYDTGNPKSGICEKKGGIRRLLPNLTTARIIIHITRLRKKKSKLLSKVWNHCIYRERGWRKIVLVGDAKLFRVCVRKILVGSFIFFDFFSSFRLFISLTCCLPRQTFSSPQLVVKTAIFFFLFSCARNWMVNWFAARLNFSFSCSVRFRWEILCFYSMPCSELFFLIRSLFLLVYFFLLTRKANNIFLCMGFVTGEMPFTKREIAFQKY